MITTARMRRLEELSEHFGVSRLTLMERAGKAIADLIASKIIASKKELSDHTVIVCAGQGNNGGDGFVAARYLSKQALVFVLFFGDEERLGAESLANLARIQDNPRIPIIRLPDLTPDNLARMKKELSGKKLILIDALLGTGAVGKIREPIATGIAFFNSLKGYKICVDIPSGINPDTGSHTGPFAKGNMIITFHDLKPGLKGLRDGVVAPKVVVAPIGIPPKAIQALKEEQKDLTAKAFLENQEKIKTKKNKTTGKPRAAANPVGKQKPLSKGTSKPPSKGDTNA